MLKIALDGTDISDWYTQSAGPLEIADALNQPVTCDLPVTAFKLPVPVIGGETLSIYDDKQIHFDGVIPVEAGIGTEFLYLDTHADPEVYRKGLKLHAVDYQAVLDYKNQPDKTFYFQSGGFIVKDMLARSPLAGLVDTTEIVDGFVMPQYAIAGRKFSNVVKELASTNGFYFSLRTIDLGDEDHPRRFKAEFRSLSDRPAPFRIDRDANGYVLKTLKFDPRSKALVNKITITGGQEASSDIVIDVFEGDGMHGRFQLSRVPFYMSVSDLLKSDFSKPIQDQNTTPTVTNPEYRQVGLAFSAGGEGNSQLQVSGSGGLFYATAFQSRDQRYTTFEEIKLDAGSSLLLGIFGSPDQATIANCKLGVWFKPDQTISYVEAGEETIPAGHPTWTPVTNGTSIYSVRIQETTQGTQASIQGDPISPPRHWYPLLAPGTFAEGSVAFTGTALEGDVISLNLNSVGKIHKRLYTIPDYIVTAEDAADTSLITLHDSYYNWLGGNGGDFRSRYYVIFKTIPAAIDAIVSVNPLQILIHEDIGAKTGDSMWIEFCEGFPNNKTVRITVDPDNPLLITLNGLDGSAGDPDSYVPYSGTAQLRVMQLQIIAKASGASENVIIGSDCSDPDLVITTENATTGTDGGADLGQLPDYFFAGAVSFGSAGAISRFITRDPIGVEVKMTRANLPLIGAHGEHMVAQQRAQKEVTLAIGSADEIAEQYTAQVVLEGNLAYLSFFDDVGSIPQTGDELRVAYKYGIPIKVTVQDDASIQMVAGRSKIPGDDGIREGQDLDLAQKVFSSDAAVRYGQQYLQSRASLFLQGSVETSSWHTQGSFPKAGQSVAIQLGAESISRSEVVTQVTATHKAVSHFQFAVSFGNLPEDFLVPSENPNIRNGPSALPYNVRAQNEYLRFQNEVKIEVK